VEPHVAFHLGASRSGNSPAAEDRGTGGEIAGAEDGAAPPGLFCSRLALGISVLRCATSQRWFS
jgi:hypothetical protein